MSYIIATGFALRGAMTGRYPVSESTDGADAIIGLSFGTREQGTSTPYGRVNHKLAGIAIGLNSFGLPMYLQEEVADAVSDAAPDNAFDIYRIGGQPSSKVGRGLDSFGVLEVAMKGSAGAGRKIERPILVAHAYHVARVALQGAKFWGVEEPILPPNLPRDFAPDSDQPWTRGQLSWISRELPGIAVLKLNGKA